MNYTNRAPYSSMYLIYRTQLEFHTGSSPAAGVVPWDKIRPLCCLIHVLLCTRGQRWKHEEKKAWSPGQSWKSKTHTAAPYTHTHTLHENDRLLRSILFVSSLSPHFSTSSRWKSRMLQCEPPTGPWKRQYTLLQHIWSKIHTHTCLHTQTTGRDLQQPHTTNMRHFHTHFYINRQLILTSMKFQGGGGHSSTDSLLIRFKFFFSFLIYVSMCVKRIITAIC